jgi:hypothetical protein
MDLKSKRTYDLVAWTLVIAQLCDGCFDVLVLREGVSSSTILAMFLEMEKGEPRLGCF